MIILHFVKKNIMCTLGLYEEVESWGDFENPPAFPYFLNSKRKRNSYGWNDSRKNLSSFTFLNTSFYLSFFWKLQHQNIRAVNGPNGLNPMKMPFQSSEDIQILASKHFKFVWMRKREDMEVGEWKQGSPATPRSKAKIPTLVILPPSWFRGNPHLPGGFLSMT